jgi:hypothetical protein
MRENHFARIAATPQAEEAWTQHAAEVIEGSLLTKANSWFVGANIPGKSRTFLLYANSAPAYRAKFEEATANGYEGFLLQ